MELSAPKRGRGRPKKSPPPDIDRLADKVAAQFDQEIAEHLNGGDASEPDDPMGAGSQPIRVSAGAVNPPQNSAKRKRIRKKPAQATEHKQILLAMKRIGLATEGLGPNAAEIFKTATLQVVQAKLQEIFQLLSLIAPQRPFSPYYSSDAPFPPPPPTPPAAKPMTLDNVDQQIAQADAVTRQRQQQRSGGENCRICGQPAAAKTSKGMPVCAMHADPSMMQAGDVVRRQMARAFGSGQGDVEIIQVNADGQVVG